MEQFYYNRWFQGKWLPFHQLRSLTGVSITLYLAGVVPYLSNCMIWAPLWANRGICFYCDNQAVIAINYFVCKELQNSLCDEPCTLYG